jgi:enoyl-CoA hydratase/carnithine racemase
MADGEPLAPEELAFRLSVDDEGLTDGPLPLVVVDASRGDVSALAAGPVPTVPAVIVGIGATHEALPGVDVVAADEADLDRIRATVSAAPRASVALALLLRSRPARSREAALVDESATYSMLQAGPEFTAWRASRPQRPRPADAEPPVRWWVRGSTMWVVLNRPHRHNAVSSALRDLLVEPLRLALAEPSWRVVLAGEGPSFSSGGDLDEFGSFDDPASAHVVRLTRSPARLLARLSARAAARVHGSCLGAGIEWAAFCGRVVARRDTVFGLPEVGLGLVPGAGGTASLPARIGRHRTAHLALTGERIDATTALAWGLVDELVDDLGDDLAGEPGR